VSECHFSKHKSKGDFMKRVKGLMVSLVLVAMLTVAAFADHIAVDYNHNVNFGQLKTYSWEKVHTANSIWDARVKDAVHKELEAKGWTQVPSGGDVSIVAVEKTSIQQQLDTFYNGFGGRRFGGIGDATTTVENYQVGTLIVSMYGGNPKQLVWRGVSSGDLSGNPDKNTKQLDKDVRNMLKKFPPRANS
jgi:hypothetical protein